MRDDNSNKLETVTTKLVQMSELVGEAIAKATSALLTDDLSLAEQVISGDEAINHLNSGVEELCFRVAALEAPMATDLRMVMGGIRMATSLERMGGLDLDDLAAAVPALRAVTETVDPVDNITGVFIERILAFANWIK
jgi:phosphate transport system protein